MAWMWCDPCCNSSTARTHDDDSPGAAVDVLPESRRSDETAQGKGTLGQPGTFSVNLEWDAQALGSLGLKLDSADDVRLMVLGVEKGMAARYNEKKPQTPIQVYDRILSVNGVQGAASDLERHIEAFCRDANAETLKLRMARPAHTVVDVSGKMGLELHYKDSSLGAVVAALEDEGSIAGWNLGHPEARICSGDHLLAVNGHAQRGLEVKQRFQNRKLPPTERYTVTFLRFADAELTM